MPKKKGLGKDCEKSLKVMGSLLDALESFSDNSKTPLKRGLKQNDALDKDISRLINDSREKASVLKNQIEDIIDSVKSIDTNKNSRFASKRVVANFLNCPD
ncbi:MAG TPA: hypothetical protein VKO61_01330 [Candidatus Paceibacterota bacterium]|nr:hypothetical protein [Candidatus Paceibacterota bacterium]